MGLTALLALLGVLLTWKAPRAQRYVLIAAVVAGLPFHALAGDFLEDRLSPPPTPADAAARRYGRLVAKEPALRKALAGHTQAEADDLAAGFAQAGLSTLPDAELDHRALLLSALVNQPDDELAAGLFTGKLDAARLVAGLNKLPAQEIEAWYLIAYEATLGALRDAPGKVPTDREKAHAMRLLVSATQLEGTRLLGVFQDPQPKVPEAAWAARKVYTTMFELPMEQRLEVERMLAAPKLAYATR